MRPPASNRARKQHDQAHRGATSRCPATPAPSQCAAERSSAASMTAICNRNMNPCQHVPVGEYARPQSANPVIPIGLAQQDTSDGAAIRKPGTDATFVSCRSSLSTPRHWLLMSSARNCSCRIAWSHPMRRSKKRQRGMRRRHARRSKLTTRLADAPSFTTGHGKPCNDISRPPHQRVDQPRQPVGLR